MAEAKYVMLERGVGTPPQLLIADGSATRNSELLLGSNLLGNLGDVKKYFETNGLELPETRESMRFNKISCPLGDGTWIQLCSHNKGINNEGTSTYGLEKLIPFN